jgi:photosystem II stability/assembly factor-like uncharacterized protein
MKQLAYRARDRLLLEYRRLTEGPLAWALLPLRAIRRWSRIPTFKMYRGAARIGSNVGLAGDGPYQLAAGALGLALVMGGWAVAPSAHRPARDLVTASSMNRTGTGSNPASTPRVTSRTFQPDAGPGARPLVAPIEDTTEQASRKGVGAATKDRVEFIIDPNQDTEEPEDARIRSVVFSPGFASDRTVFAAGAADCARQLCPSVLFRSTDGGETWTREPAVGMVADSLLLPPAFGLGDNRIFVMGAQGLQVSYDRGATFRPASVASGPQTVGSAAMSPAFNGDDPSILIGAEMLMSYRDDRKTLEPVPGTAPTGRFEPAFSPAYPSDRTVLLGGSRLDPVMRGRVATVQRCVDGLCTEVSLEGEHLPPRVRVASGYATTGRVLAFTPTGVFLSEDRAESFAPLPLGWSGELLWDLVVDPQGRLVAATVPASPGGHAGVYLSSDGGLSWGELQSDLFAGGAATLGVSGDRIVVALAEGGVACSSDAGLTWAPRCQASSPS